MFVCDELHKTVIIFIWKRNTSRGLHLVNWKTITKRRSSHGLGVRLARSQNTALHGKLVWDLMHSLTKLRVEILRDLRCGFAF